METALATFFILQIGFRKLFFPFERIPVSLRFKVTRLILENVSICFVRALSFIALWFVQFFAEREYKGDSKISCSHYFSTYSNMLTSSSLHWLRYEELFSERWVMDLRCSESSQGMKSGVMLQFSSSLTNSAVWKSDFLSLHLPVLICK